MTAEIIRLNDFRVESIEEEPCDMVTAVDVAIRDLREILQIWGTDAARARAQECERMLTRVFAGNVIPPGA